MLFNSTKKCYVICKYEIISHESNPKKLMSKRALNLYNIFFRYHLVFLSNTLSLFNLLHICPVNQLKNEKKKNIKAINHKKRVNVSKKRWYGLRSLSENENISFRYDSALKYAYVISVCFLMEFSLLFPSLIPLFYFFFLKIFFSFFIFSIAGEHLFAIFIVCNQVNKSMLTVQWKKITKITNRAW